MTPDRAEEHLLQSVSERLSKSALPDRVSHIILAAFDGVDALDELVDFGVLPEAAKTKPARESPVGAYITALTVEGFRGVGEATTLELAPGPGLTLVIGRNGSGKSSFAEALEVLLTGDNQRWARRSAVWREGWRNLHHQTAAIETRLAVEGVVGDTVATRVWKDGDELDRSTVTVQPHGLPKTSLGFLGWNQALLTYRPFLSYSELGAMLDEGPTKLYDAVAAVLGLEELTSAEKTLRDVRLTREKAWKALLVERDYILGLMFGLDDPRAREARTAIDGTVLNLDVVERLVSAPTAEQGGELGALQRVVSYEFPQTVPAAANELAAAQAEVAEVAGTQADRLLRSAELLEQAIRFREDFDAEDCPVCASPDVLTGEWADAASETAESQREAAAAARRAQDRLARAMRAATALVTDVPQAVRDARPLLDVGAVLAAWQGWVALKDIHEPAELARRLEPAAQAVQAAIAALRTTAEAEITRRQDAWRPVALALSAWLSGARNVRKAHDAVPDLKKAEAWLKKEGVAIRNERFEPIEQEAMETWKLLRQRSNVRLGGVELAGTGTRRRVALDVTVDGVSGSALGVMSQGELHSLALSLFFPRATMDESPFRFIVIDDPVQSMDPAKVDGLAQVLDRAATKRQVIVFTHDDRLPEAVRRLGIGATVIEVTRKEDSIVDLRPALDPVERHIDDARALCRTEDLPDQVARRVVPGFCRLAIEAACIQAVRRRRIGRGEPHADVERLLEKATTVTTFAALALFDNGQRGGDVLGRINSQFGGRSGDAFKAVSAGAHKGHAGDLRDLVSSSAILARQLAESA
jgi:energy-coupling factor transporter ATP-binding protein EcfA2